MTLDYTFRPIDQWPGERARSRIHSPFRSTQSQTMRLLERELQMLKAKQIVIQADCGDSEIRRDGMLRADARLRGPGIILSFESKHGPLSYPCDRYHDWQDNLRAIALALEALRAVDRYGVTRRAEQYKGWAKLPGPAATFDGTTEAVLFLSRHSLYTPNAIADSADNFAKAYRVAAGRLHPDRNNGDDTQFKRLQAARVILEKHHGI